MPAPIAAEHSSDVVSNEVVASCRSPGRITYCSGKLPIRINQELPGFLVNRIQIAIKREV